MTRWYVIHATQGVTLARNVGYLSIGHGYYLEDGTETDNKFYSNLGVFARAAIRNPQNPRQVPGILAAPYPARNDPSRKRFPSTPTSTIPPSFWIMNGWNDFQYNMAAGCGDLRRLLLAVPAANSTMSRYEKWMVIRLPNRLGAPIPIIPWRAPRLPRCRILSATPAPRR